MNARAPAPEFPADLGWVNVSKPPRIADQRGRVVLLWFWTYDAVNCWNVVPDLRQLEDRYHDGLAVIGLHCPKYTQQRSDEPLLRAVNRLRLRHAVANDAGFRVWQAYGIEAWPSVALVDAEGRLAGVFSGEGRREEIEAAITRLLDEAAARDLRVYEPTPPALRPEPRHALAFPGRVLAEDKLLYVADSGHHRILECNHEGRVLRRFGSGNAGYSDGTAVQACFNDPQGLARWGDALYVADAGNHAVRRIKLGDGAVDTVLGTGRPGRSRPHGEESERTLLNTPLDLAVLGDDLYVAVAGQHQIWKLDLIVHEVSVFAGSGELGLVDGVAEKAAFAQPSALAVAGRQLVVADAAASALRFVGLDDGQVDTALGSGLYEFGDAGGVRADVRLQNPLGVATDMRGTIYIADSYNHSIKLMNRKSGATRPLRLDYRLHEPRGLSLHGNLLWVANTNLHEIACIDMLSGLARRVPVGES
jgi:hypothetical protein